MRNFVSVLAVLLLLLAVNGGCNSKESESPGQSKGGAGDHAGVVPGRWKSEKGDKSKGESYSVITMDLRKDGTLSFVNVTQDSGKAGQEIQNNAEGHWTIDGHTVTVFLDKSADGHPIRSQEQKKVYAIDDKGKSMVDLDDSTKTDFFRQ